ncbi:MAG: NAD(P)-dependent oxidoreductase [Desulfobacteraceae bacterium]|nr:MAG: NAD(P)-dependent oxidoreductase [Desulfobacteraceae bacterium]
MPRTLAITGATGFIGAALLRELAGRGNEIRALFRARPGTPGNGASRTEVQWVRGSLADMDSLVQLTRGAEVVIHCAGAVRGATQAQFDRVNREGVARLVEAARRAHPLPRFLLISSLAAREPQLSLYAASKRGGEEALRAAGQGMGWSVLRPPAVYGPGDREMRPLLKAMQRGVAPMLGRAEARFSMIFVADLASAVRHLLEQPTWETGPFELHDGHTGGYTWRDVITTLERITRRPVRPVPVPAAVLKAVAAANQVLARLLGYAPMLTPGKVCELTHPDWVCRDAPFREATGWVPRVSLEEGLRRTLESFSGNRN